MLAENESDPGRVNAGGQSGFQRQLAQELPLTKVRHGFVRLGLRYTDTLDYFRFHSSVDDEPHPLRVSPTHCLRRATEHHPRG